jgi:cell shape-determining protein MreC
LYDKKVVRRRRAVLGVLVALSIALLTIYFGENGGGILHGVQNGTSSAFSPLEKGVSIVFKPVSNFTHWTGDVFHAKKENKQLKQQVQQLRGQLAQAQTAQRDAAELRGLVGLITDESSAVSAEVMPDGSNGIVRPEVGNPGDMLLDYIDKGAKIHRGDSVVTSGFTSSKLDSLFPRGIPVGKVTKVSPSEIEQYQRVHMQPYADLRRMNYVQVLTGNAEQQRAQVVK